MSSEDDITLPSLHRHEKNICTLSQLHINSLFFWSFKQQHIIKRFGRQEILYYWTCPVLWRDKNIHGVFHHTEKEKMFMIFFPFLPVSWLWRNSKTNSYCKREKRVSMEWCNVAVSKWDCCSVSFTVPSSTVIAENRFVMSHINQILS
jgi:hypothetical protein